MKRIFTLSSLVLPGFALWAQISIVKTDMPSENDTFRISLADITQFDTTLLFLDSTGVDYVWNYSWLESYSQRVDTFYPVLSTPAGYWFYFYNCFLYPDHCSSYALRGEDIDFGGQMQLTELFNYYKNETSSYRNTGFGAKLNGYPTSVRFTPTDYIYNFPLNYGNKDTSYSSFGFDIPNYGYYGRNQKRMNSADGWGTLTTPFGTFDVLRVKSTIEINDTIFSDSLGGGITIPRNTEYEYKWLAKNEGVPVLQVHAQDGFFGPVVVAIEYRDSFPSTIGIKENALNDFDITLYPNPATDVAILEISNYLTGRTGYSIELFDMLGRKTGAALPMTLVTKSSYVFLIDLTNLNQGCYFYRVTESATDVHTWGKIIKN